MISTTDFTNKQEKLGEIGRTWKRILIISRGEITVRDIPPDNAPAMASISTRLRCLGSSMVSTEEDNGKKPKTDENIEDHSAMTTVGTNLKRAKTDVKFSFSLLSHSLRLRNIVITDYIESSKLGAI
ncbi:hypothetical protein HPP92_001171 [Vanilla planifolia]|uniref:Uncharacterized protein n=1 Tax=Vanilla planifolia TaxID=51239 RepID=A0A835VHR0_VANPL|nr:hypothetical protein HPP92_001171 [Vanilla planifolia]